MNGKSRQKATNIIEKDFFILLNNLHFGYMATIAEITLIVEYLMQYTMNWMRFLT